MQDQCYKDAVTPLAACRYRPSCPVPTS